MTHRFGINRIKSNHQDDVNLAERSKFKNFKEEKRDRLHESILPLVARKTIKAIFGLTFDLDNKFKI